VVSDVLMLDLPARKEYVGLARQLLSIIAGASGLLDEGRVDDLTLAASEACMNAVECYVLAPEGGDQRVVVHLTRSASGLTVTVDDSGPGFDPGTISQEAMRADEHPASRRSRPCLEERGRGVSIIRALVDDLAFDTSVGGTSVRMAVRAGS
jgi:anti-sigma regulatory factor (Ser/Thr protein kinase)